VEGLGGFGRLDRVRIDAQLIQCIAERTCGADAYERTLADIVALPADVTVPLPMKVADITTAQERDVC